ncbi:MAG TPA: helicase-exonuclease AddAB subunit AddA [Bacillota bacterium]|nr:helicase-exonuclease AddAB subunit AddA [Bacillota bacterium]
MLNGEWTAEQLEAVSGSDGNLLLSASAGTGKTAVLVERIVRRITDPGCPVDVDRLLVVTFTNAAAAEMRDRIGRALAGRMKQQPGSKHLGRQLALLGRASICTIHSFCLDLLRQYFYRIDLDPGFRVADETEEFIIQAEVLEELFERRFASKENHLFTVLADSYGGKRGDEALQELVQEAFRFARSTPRPEEWLAKLSGHFYSAGDEPLDRLPWIEVLKKSLEIELAAAAAALETGMKLAGGPGGPSVYLPVLEEDRDLVLSLYRKCSAGASWADLHEAFKAAGFGRLKSFKGNDAERWLADRVRKLRDVARRKIGRLQKEYFSRSPEEACSDLIEIAPLVNEFAGLVLDFAESYRKAKAARGVVDFSDLEHYCLKLLEESGPDGPVPSETARELRKRYVEVLVDEYQDINPVQEAILRMVSRQGEEKPNLFMVGDVKQSIYRFRLAEPGLFMEKYRLYDTGRGSRQRRLDLSKNFRSRRCIVDAVNFVFRQLMTPALGEIEYGGKAELVYGADYPSLPEDFEDGRSVELCLVERREAAEGRNLENGQGNEGDGGELVEEEVEDEPEAVQREARLIAAKIKEMVEGAGGKPGFVVYDRELGALRPVAYRDVTVLMRATAGYANTFLDEFRQEGVPAYSETATGYFEATEVETVISLLKVIDNPRQDIPLAGVLRSPVVGLKAEDLATVRMAARRGDYYDAVVAAAKSGQGELSEKLADFLEKLERWRTAARQGSLADLVWHIYRETRYYDFVGGLPGGAQRQANLRALYHRARQFESTTLRGLFLFLRYIGRIRENGRDLGTARILGEKENVVRIASIHKSKGLEFPVVFLAGLGRKFNFKDLNKDIIFHNELGIGPQFVDLESRATYPTLAKLAVKHRLQMEALAEELRILYVAMTRAREKLILVGSVRNLADCVRRWCGQVGRDGWRLPPGELAGARTYLDWLVPAVMSHKDAAALREMGLCEECPSPEIAGDASSWKIVIADGRAGAGKAQTPAPKIWSFVRRTEPLGADGILAKTVKNRLEWTYPARCVLGKAAKITVSDLAHRFELREAEDGDIFRGNRMPIGKRPLFLQEYKGLTAAEAGSAVHLVMQHLDLKDALDLPSINRQIAVMVEKELLTSEQAEAVQAWKIADFFRGELGRRVLAGNRVFRELHFTLVLPAEEIYPDIGANVSEKVLVQGVVDCLVDEGDGGLLLDYKTDRTAPAEAGLAAAKHSGQISLYARAVEEILGVRVKEKHLYFFDAGVSVRL